MFIRKNRRPAGAAAADHPGADQPGSGRPGSGGSGSGRPDSVGVGALVTVTGGASGGSGWVGEPTGLVIAPGDNEMAGYPGLAPGGPVSWLVAFDEPAFKVGNDVPFDEATVAARFVVPLPLQSDPAALE